MFGDHSKFTKKSLLDVILQFFLKEKREKMSLENLQTLCKLCPNSKKICAHNFFFHKKYACSHSINTKKSCARIFFFEFGESNSFFPFFEKIFFLKNDIKQRFLCEFGDSPNSLQTHSKLAPNSQRNFCLISFFIFCEKEEK